jgi:hypothetical protein
MSSEGGAEEDGCVREDPSGCLVDKTPQIYRRDHLESGEGAPDQRLSLKGIIIPVLHHCQENAEPGSGVLVCC